MDANFNSALILKTWPGLVCEGGHQYTLFYPGNTS